MCRAKESKQIVIRYRDFNKTEILYWCVRDLDASRRFDCIDCENGLGQSVSLHSSNIDVLGCVCIAVASLMWFYPLNC